MLQKSLLKAQQSGLRMFSSANYHNLQEHLFYTPVQSLVFKTDKLPIFDNTSITEKRFSPFELKEITFKNFMGMAGTLVIANMYPVGVLCDVACAGWCLNWAYSSYQYMSSSISKVELHKDGKSVTLTPKFGAAFTVKISAIEKQRHEKTLVETYEEAFLFPILVSGKLYHLHGNGQEAIKNGEIFRAVINGQSVKL